MGGDLVIFGSGGHAKVLVEAVRARTAERPIHLVDDSPDAVKRLILGLSVSGGREWLLSVRPGSSVALGIGDNAARDTMAEWLLDHGFALETVVHPSAIVGRTVGIGDGAFIAAGAVLIADSEIGQAAIVNTGASVDHDCRLGTAVHLGPGVRLCGNVQVGDRTLIGVGSAVLPGIRIGADAVIGGGSAVATNVPDGQRVAGCPARPLD